MNKFIVYTIGLVIFLVGMGSARAEAAEIALLDSSVNTANFFDWHYDECAADGNFLGRDEYRRYFLGWDYVLRGQLDNAMVDRTPPLPLGTVYPHDVIYDVDVTEDNLANYKILILSNTASLDDFQIRAIHKWVIHGGKLIATFGSGYKDITEDLREDDELRKQKGHTGGLHQLWHDPWNKAFGTQSISPEDPILPGIDIMVTRIFGPTDIDGWTQGAILSYGAEANLLMPRPEHFRNALAFLRFDPADSWDKPHPAILLNRAGRGEVVYFAYAPEFIVALAFDLAGHCDGDGNYPDNSPAIDDEGPGAKGPDLEDFPNAFVGVVSEDGTEQVNADRVDRQLLLMERTIKYMVTGN